MTLPGVTEFTSNGTQAVFYCPGRPMLTWVSSDTTTFYIASIIYVYCFCSDHFLKHRSGYGRMENTSVTNKLQHFVGQHGGSRCLVGAVSMPLCIIASTFVRHVLLLRKELSQAICRITLANQLVLYGAVCSTLYGI